MFDRSPLCVSGSFTVAFGFTQYHIDKHARRSVQGGKPIAPYQSSNIMESWVWRSSNDFVEILILRDGPLQCT